MTEKLKIKDLVTIGIFTVIYMALVFAVGMIGLVPILFLVYPTVAAIVSGVVIMLFMAREQKPWALFIMGMLSPVLMALMGHTFVVPLVSLIFIGLAEYIFRKGGFKSFKHNAIAYGIFSCWPVTSLMQLLLVKERYKQLSDSMMDPSYFKSLEVLITWQSLTIVLVGAFIGGVIGAFIGKAMLKKHFVKAGIV